MIELMVTTISLWCSVDHPGFTTESKQVCIEVATNSPCFDYRGELTKSETKIKECVQAARDNLRRKELKK